MFSNFGAIRHGTAVKVFMGADWQKGTVKVTSATSCSVQVSNRLIAVYDLRNIKPA